MTWTTKLDFVNAPHLSDLAVTQAFNATPALSAFEPVDLSVDTFVFNSGDIDTGLFNTDIADTGASDGSITTFGSGAASASFSGFAAGAGASSVSATLSAFTGGQGDSGASLDVSATGDVVEGFGSVATKTDFDTLMFGTPDLQPAAPAIDLSLPELDLSFETLPTVGFDLDLWF